MNDFLRELCTWLDGNRFGKKILFCRSIATGNQLLRMAASCGIPVVNTQAMTVQGYIDQLAEPVLIERGLQKIDHITASIALQEIMERAGDAFTTLGVVELTTAESILPQLDELERNGLTPDQLEAVGEPLLAKIWQDYIDWRRQNDYASREQILNAAFLPDGISYAVLSNLQLSQIEQRFLEKIQSPTIIHILTPCGVAVPRNAVLQTAAAEKNDTSAPACIECQDIGAEIRAAFQHLLENGIPAEDTVIVCPDNGYGLRVEEEGKLLGVGIGSAFGTPASMTKTALLIRSLLDWAQRNYDVEALTQALVSAGMAVYDEKRKLELSGQELLRMFRGQNIGWGAERWTLLAESDNERYATAGQVMAAWVELFETEELPVREIALKLINLLNRCMPRGVENEFYLNIVDEVSRIYSGTMNAFDYLAIVEAIAASYSVGSETTEDPGKVYCCAYENAMYVNRKHFIMLGMSWDAFNRLGREFPLLHDDEKAKLSSALRLAGDSTQERRYAVMELMANRRDAQVLFSRARMDHVGGEDIMASSLFDDAMKQTGLVQQITILGRQPLTELDVHLKSGLDFDGEDVIMDEGREELWKKEFNQRIWTATQLEKALSCPRSFMLSSQMGVKEERPEALEQFGQAWLGAADRGNLIHGILEQYFRETAPRVEMPDEGLLERLTSEAVERYKKLLPIPANLDDIQPEVDGILSIVKQEAKMHAEDTARMTLDTEYEFGSDEPVELTFGSHTIRLTGRIDRVDLVDADYEVIDYKTGRPHLFKNDLDYKLQYYLYSLAWEKTHPLQPIGRASYDLLDSVGGIERVTIEMTDDERGRMYEKVTALLDLLEDPYEALITRYELHPAEECPKYCPYLDICNEPIWPEPSEDEEG